MKVRCDECKQLYISYAFGEQTHCYMIHCRVKVHSEKHEVGE